MSELKVTISITDSTGYLLYSQTEAFDGNHWPEEYQVPESIRAAVERAASELERMMLAHALRHGRELKLEHLMKDKT